MSHRHRGKEGRGGEASGWTDTAEGEGRGGEVERRRGREGGGRSDGSISVGAPLPRQRGLSPPGGTQTLSPCPALYSPLATAARSI